MSALPNKPAMRSGAREHSDGFSRRIRFGKDQRRTFRIAGARNKPEADKIADELQKMALRLTDAGYAAEGAVILDGFAGAGQDSERERHRRLVDGLCSPSLKVDTAKLDRAGTTFRVLAKRWTSGDLARDFPDHVAVKKTSEADDGRLERVSAIELPEGGTFGDLPLARVTLDCCEHVMRHLPDSAKRPATRRQYAQVVRRVLELAPLWWTSRKGLLSSEFRQCSREKIVQIHSRKTPSTA